MVPSGDSTAEAPKVADRESRIRSQLDAHANRRGGRRLRQGAHSTSVVTARPARRARAAHGTILDGARVQCGRYAERRALRALR